ncbi:hypothetical protein ACFYYR_00445 [Streptomyces sp. NPDC001922]|uniref:hypothetical protein n=1 Tax=Streptomyces sp. NPDC001922 TaxID=3364624 RepID=UPI00369387A6
MPETEQARAFLWKLQARVAEARGWAPPQQNDAFMRSIAKGVMPGATEEQLDAIIASSNQIPEHWPRRGPHEDMGGYWLIHTLADTLERHIRPPFVRPTLGTLVTGEINAVTLLVPGSDAHLVVFEDQLLNFANLFSKAVALAMPFEGGDDGMLRFSVDMDEVHRHLRESPEALERFREVVFAYLLHGEPGSAPQYFASPQVSGLASILRNGLELFVLGHEYGHVLDGHLADGTASRRLLGTSGPDVAEATWSWEKEHIADLIGWNLSMSAMNEQRYDLALSHAGVELFFSAYEVLNRALSLLMRGTDTVGTSTTHPPASDRRELLRINLQQSVPEHAESAIGLANGIQEIVDTMWKSTAPLVLEMHRGGRRPDVRWL